MLNKKKTVTIILILICALQLGVSLFWASKKCYLFQDEFFTYAASNRLEGISADFPVNEWLDEEWIYDYVVASSEHKFDYSIPYHNQDKDVHPPLYYMFVHTASSLIPDEFSYWAGIGFNIVFFIGCTIVLYFLGKELFASKGCGLLVAFLFSISFGGLNTMVFVRMYMLMTLLILLHTYVYIKYMGKEEVPLKGYLFLVLTMAAGALTQYYFLIAAFFLAAWYTIQFIVKKQYKKLGKYLVSIAASAGISLAVYPTMWKHIFSSGRGVEARENFSAAGGYLANLKTMWNLLDSQLFTNLFKVVLLGLLALAVIYFVREKKVNKEFLLKAGAITFGCLGYFFIVTKVAPYQIDRYLMPIYPLVYLLVIGGIFCLMGKIIPAKAAAVLCILGFGGLSAIHIVHSGIPYTYERNQGIQNRNALAEKYSDNYAVYIGEQQDISPYYDVMQVLTEYKGYYNISDLTSVSEIQSDMELLQDESQVVLYINKNMNDEIDKVYELIETVLPETSMNEECRIARDEKWHVYLLNLE